MTRDSSAWERAFSLSVTPLVAALPSGQTGIAIAAGGDTTCVKTASKRLYCWGDNTCRQVGNDSAENIVATPSRVTW